MEKKKVKIRVAKGVQIPRGKEQKIKKKPGSSNVGKYKDVDVSQFAGSAGGSSPYSFPINTEKRAKAALAYSRNAPRPEGIKRAVYKKYPALKKRKEQREGKE